MVAGEARVKDHILLYLSLTSKLFYQLWARCCGLTGFHRYVAPVIVIVSRLNILSRTLSPSLL
jgi:hypothetical protein